MSHLALFPGQILVTACVEPLTNDSAQMPHDSLNGLVESWTTPTWVALIMPFKEKKKLNL